MDNKPVVFRLKIWNRLLIPMVFFGFMLFFIWWSSGFFLSEPLTNPFDQNSDFIEILPDLIMTGFVVSFYLFWLVCILGIMYFGVHSWKFRLIFGKTHIGIRSMWNPFMPKKAYAYTDILKVTRGDSRGVIKFIPKHGKPLQIGVGMLEGDWPRLSPVLNERFTPEQLDANLSSSLWQFTWADRLQYILAWTFIIYIPIQYLIIFPNTPLQNYWWKPIDGVKERYVEAMNVDKDGSVWVISGEGFRGSSYTVNHFTEGTAQTWKFTVPDSGVSNPRYIANDGNGNPWIIFDDVSFRRKDQSWEEIKFPSQISEPSAYYNFKIQGSNLWTFVYNDDGEHSSLLHWDLAQNQASVINFPYEENNLFWEKLVIAPDGGLWLYRYPRQETGTIEIYRYSGSQWKTQPPYLLPKNKEFISAFHFDATVDSAGQSWLLLAFNDLEEYTVAHFNTQNGTWRTTNISPFWGDKYTKSYEEIEIDPLGRMWLSGNTVRLADDRGDERFVSVIQPEWGGTSSNLVTYTNSNSAFSPVSFYSFQIGPDGRVWALDSARWMNGNSEKLSQPLTNWIDLDILKIVIQFAFVLVIIPVEILYFYFRGKSSHPHKTQL